MEKLPEFLEVYKSRFAIFNDKKMTKDFNKDMNLYVSETILFKDNKEVLEKEISTLEKKMTNSSKKITTRFPAFFTFYDIEDILFVEKVEVNKLFLLYPSSHTEMMFRSKKYRETLLEKISKMPRAENNSFEFDSLNDLYKFCANNGFTSRFFNYLIRPFISFKIFAKVKDNKRKVLIVRMYAEAHVVKYRELF